MLFIWILSNEIELSRYTKLYFPFNVVFYNHAITTLGKNACKIASMRYAYPAVIQVKISNIGCLDEVVGFILSKWRTTAINAIKNKTQHFGK